MAMGIGKKAILSERVARLKQSLLETRPRLSCERIRCLLESYRETEGQSPPLRRARVFEKLLTEMTVFIDDNPIVGTQTQYRCGMNPYPEHSCDWMVEEAEAYTSLGKYAIPEEDRIWLRKAAGYWGDRCRISRTSRIWHQKHPGEPSFQEMEAPLFFSPAPLCRGRVNIDYARVLNQGLNGVIAEAVKQMESLPMPVDSLEVLRKRDFLEAVIISCRAVIGFARRYAILAKEMADKEAVPERKKELERIHDTCMRVPANPATSFYEAVQSFWFVHVASQIEEAADGRSPGRFGQYTYPFYKAEREAGRLSEEDALELLELLFIKFTEIVQYKRQMSFAGVMGNMYQNISIGGLTGDGGDATTELDYLLIEAQRRVRLIQPTLSVLYHDRLSPDFLMKAGELVRTGIGMPAFFNNHTIVQGLLASGASLEDARDCCISGCVERATSRRLCSLKMSGCISMPKLLELALNNGIDPLTGKQLGPRTGEAASFRSSDELEAAVETQLRHFMKIKMEWESIAAAAGALDLPQPFTSALLDDCIERGKDMFEGGARYQMDGCTPVGMVDLADSLAAVRKLVFEDKTVSMAQLLDALAADFEGHEELRHRFLEAPKFGNDDDYVDLIARKWYDLFEKEHRKYTNHLGVPTKPFAASVVFHVAYGKQCGALPSGRKSRIAFADASVSPHPGMDRNGPAALIHSATKVLDTVRYASGQINMKFHPAAIDTKEGLSKLIALVKTYMDMGGHHIQFNVVSAGTLNDARLHPGDYRDLIVRVAGFSAYFIYLDSGVQDEIIRRTEIRL